MFGSKLKFKGKASAAQFPKAKQAGFALVPLIVGVVVVLGALVAYLATSGTSGTTSGIAANGDKIKSSGVLDGASSVSQAYDQLALNGVDPTTITYDTNAATGLFAPTVTGIDKPVLQATSILTAGLAATEGYYVYKKNGLKLNGVGTPAGIDVAVVASGVTQNVCAQINQSIYGTTTIPASGKLVADWVGGATSAAPTSTAAVDVSAVAAMANMPSGCVSTSDATPHYVAFKALSPA